MNRINVLNIIPKPTNSEVIVYDTNLKDLLDVNVFEEYTFDYTNYSSIKETFNSLEKEISNYRETINSAYLYNTSWKEEDYLRMLQVDKKTYSTLYSNIKKLEDKINVYKTKIETFNQQIEMQQIKDNKELEKKKKNLDEDIKKKQEKLFYLKEKTLDLKNDLDYINKNIEETIINKDEIVQMLESLNNDIYLCPYCNSKLENKRNKNKVEKSLNEKINDIDKMLSKYQKRKTDLESKINELVKEQKEITISLNNDIQFQNQDFNFYTKKSVEVLKLENLKNKTANDMSKVEKQLKMQPNVNSDDFIKLKDRIQKYELSLDNLRRIKLLKIKYQEKIETYNQLNEQVKSLENKITKELNFISIYYKLCEQRINNFIGENITFKLFKIEKFELVEILEIYYNGIFYENLNEESKLFVDKTIAKNIYKDL